MEYNNWFDPQFDADVQARAYALQQELRQSRVEEAARALAGFPTPSASNSSSARLPPPEKWTGEAYDVRNNAAPRPEVWLTMYNHYCQQCNLNPLNTFTCFVAGSALDWWLDLCSHYSTSGGFHPSFTWDMVMYEFNMYYGSMNITPSSEARQNLFGLKCTMSQYPSVHLYEREFRRLVRTCGDLSVPTQICWFLKGLTPDLRRACATQPSGVEWLDLDSLLTFAKGVEKREAAAHASAGPSTSTKKSHLSLAAATTQGSGSKQKPRHKKQKEKVQPAKGPVGVKKHTRYPWGRKIIGLYHAAKHAKYLDPEQKEYTIESFDKVFSAGQCIRCHKVRPQKGVQPAPGECTCPPIHT